MATLTATAAQSTVQAKFIENGVIARSCLYTFTAAQSAGDVIQMVKVPAGAHIHDVETVFNLGGGALTVNIGDGNSTGRYNASLSTNVAAIVHTTVVAGIGYSYSAEDTIDIVVGTATSASAAGTIRLTVLYSMDQAQDGNS